MYAFRSLIAAVLVTLLSVNVHAKKPSQTPWLAWADKAPKEDLRAMLRYLEDQRAGLVGIESLLSHHDRDVRGFALLALSRSIDVVHEGVISSLEDADSEVRRTAAFGLGQIGDLKGEEPLLRRLSKEESVHVKSEIWKALGRVGGNRTLQVIEEQGKLSAEAVIAGGLILSRQKAQTDAHSLIAKALASKEPAVMAAGFYGLSRSRQTVTDTYKMKAAQALESVYDADVRRATIKLLAKSAGRAGGMVTRLLKSRPFSGHERASLVQGIARTESSRTERRLVGLLRHEVRQLRSRDAWLSDGVHPAMVIASNLAKRTVKRGLRTKLEEVLGWLPRRSKTEAAKRRIDVLRCELSAALGRLDSVCREARAVSLGWRIGRERSVLDKAFDSPRTDVRIAAWSALSGSDSEAFSQKLARGLGDSDLVVAATVVDLAVTEKISLTTHVRELLDLWARAWKAQDAEVLLTLISALKTMPSEAVTKSLRQAGDSNQLALKRAAIGALGGLKSSHEFKWKKITQVPSKEAYAPFRSDQVAAWRTVHIKSSIGTFEIAFLRAFAPMTAKKIGELFENDFYNGLTFHRVVSNFVVQGGDPRGDGWGGPGYTMRCENNPIDYKAGTVGMALAGKDTGGSQFFIALDSQPHLLGTYTVFGRVSKGMDVVRALVPGDKILSADLKR